MAVEDNGAVTLSGGEERKDRVVHARFGASELAAVDGAADAAGLSLSAFIRSLALEGAGVRPFLTDEDRAVIDMLAGEMLAIAADLNQLARSVNRAGRVSASDVSGTVVEVQRLAVAVVLELRRFAMRGAHRRRGAG